MASSEQHYIISFIILNLTEDSRNHSYMTADQVISVLGLIHMGIIEYKASGDIGSSNA